MYEVLISIGKKLFPSLLTSQEERLRKILTWKHRGSNYQCNICETKLSSFINRKNGDRLCPRCGSVGRTRRLFSILHDHTNSMRVLHFSPPRALKQRLQEINNWQYQTTDFEGQFEADHSYDITDIDCDDNKFDLIICYHVLEHIVADIKAMSELYRIIAKTGRVYIQTPFSTEGLKEDYSVTSKKDRLLEYGQDDHVRIYTVEVLVARLRQVGFNVETHEYHEELENYHGYKTQEYVLIANKK